MRIQFTKNIQFTRLLKVDGRLREFNFRKLGGPNEGIFTVDTVDDRGNRLMFRMKKDDEVWKILPIVMPQWILENEGNFHLLIEEELKIS
jgi:hypothetical protein